LLMSTLIVRRSSVKRKLQRSGNGNVYGGIFHLG
jgi:hypothetical protein